jgi:hypothetical protein
MAGFDLTTEEDCPRIVKYPKTSAAKREVDLHPDVAEFLHRYTAGKLGLRFHTAMHTASLQQARGSLAHAPTY